MKKMLSRVLGLGLAVALPLGLTTGCVDDLADVHVPNDGGSQVITPVVPTATVLPTATATFTPGVQTVTVPSWQDAPMTLNVTFTENQIADITIVEHGDSAYGTGWFLRSGIAVPDQILVHQSTNGLDTFTGATTTQGAIVAAVEEAITLAGANPADLVPQQISAPLTGDRFIPGFVELTVPANTLDINGNPASDAVDTMLFSDVDMTIRVSFGRNHFHLHNGNRTNASRAQLGQNDSHGDSAYAINDVTAENFAELQADASRQGPISGGTWGGWYFRQLVDLQANDQQSTHGIDINTGATRSASGIKWGLEQAMIQQGANPAAITPLADHPIVITAPASGIIFNPGIYTTTVDGFGGPMEVRVTMDRALIRRIEVLNHNETPMFWDMVWGNAADNVVRDAIFLAQTEALDTVDTVSGATVSSTALITAVQQIVNQAGQ
jgi:fumarate reductase flavoprotein subunit